MGSIRDSLCETFIQVQMKSMEFLTADQAFEIATEEGAYPENEDSSSVLAHLARARAYVLGEFVANEYETPDSDREWSDGSLICSRKEAVNKWYREYRYSRYCDGDHDQSRRV